MDQHYPHRPTPARKPAVFLQRLLTLSVTLGVVACDTMIGPNAEIWFVVGLLGAGALGGIGMFFSFLRKFRAHVLASGKKSPEEFSTTSWWFCGVVLGAAMSFAFYNWFSQIDIPPGQQWRNIGAWFAGSVLGGTVGHVAGRRLAFRTYTKEAAANSRNIGSIPNEGR